MFSIKGILAVSLLLMSGVAQAIEPLSEEDMSLIDGQSSPLPMFLKESDSEEINNPARVQNYIPNVLESYDANSNGVLTMSVVSLLGEALNASDILSVIMAVDGQITLDVSGQEVGRGSIGLIVDDISAESLTGVTTTLGVRMDSVRIEGVNSNTTIDFNSGVSGVLSTRLNGNVDAVMVERMRFGDSPVLNSYTMHDIQVTNTDLTINAY